MIRQVITGATVLALMLGLAACEGNAPTQEGSNPDAVLHGTPEAYVSPIHVDLLRRHEKGGPRALGKAGKLLAVLAADAVGGFEGAKIGGFLGGLLGPAGASLGGVIGAIVIGGGASYGTGAQLSGSCVYGPPSPYDEDPGNQDSIGHIHNELLAYLTANATPKEDGSIDYDQLYNLSVSYVESRGYDSLDYYMPESNYLSTVEKYDTVSTESQVEDILDTYYPSYPDEVLYLESMFEDVDSVMSASGNAYITFNTYESGVDTMSVSIERKSHLRYAISIAKYSYAIWNENL